MSYIVDYVDFTHIDMSLEDRRKIDVGDIYLNVIKHNVPECGWIIRSKNRRDYVTCKCGELSIDGGSWYVKLYGDIKNAELHTVMYRDIKKNEENEETFFDSREIKLIKISSFIVIVFMLVLLAAYCILF